MMGSNELGWIADAAILNFIVSSSRLLMRSADQRNVLWLGHGLEIFLNAVRWRCAFLHLRIRGRADSPSQYTKHLYHGGQK